MLNWPSLLSVTIVIVSLCSCATKRTVTHSKGDTEQFGDRYTSDVKFEVGKDGSVKPTSNKRSSLERKGNYSGYSPQSGKSYSKEGYQSKSWSANKGYDAKSYQGGSDASKFLNEPHFANRQSSVQGMRAGLDAEGYGTNQYSNGSQTVNRGKQIDKQVDANTQSEQESFVEPTIRPLSEVNQLSVEETNMMLGR